MPPKRKRVTKRVRLPSPTPSEQAILDALPIAGDLVSRLEQKSPSDVKPAYLIYIIARTDINNLPQVFMRKIYESKTDAAEAFTREYLTWTGMRKSSVYPQQHTEKELSRAYLINLMDCGKAETASLLHPDMIGNIIFTGRSKIEYEIVHRDDRKMDGQDCGQRKIVVVCEETTFETL